MAIQKAIFATILSGVLLTGCASRIPISETSCQSLDKAMHHGYLLVSTQEEAMRRINDSPAIKQDFSKQKREAVKNLYIDKRMRPLINAYYDIETEYNSRCPKPAPLTTALKNKYPSKLIH